MSKASIHTSTNLQIKNKNARLCTVKLLAPSSLGIDQARAKLLNNRSRLQGNQTKVPCEGSQVYEGVARDKTI